MGTGWVERRGKCLDDTGLLQDADATQRPECNLGAGRLNESAARGLSGVVVQLR